MGPNRAKSLAEQLAELDNPAPKDFDPEEDAPPVEDDDDSDAPEVDESAAREHYAPVGKSKLRKRDIVPLGPRYEGAKISRDDVEEDEDEDDPFSRGFDEEESESEGEDGGAESLVTDPSDEDEDDEDSSERAELRKLMAEGRASDDDDDEDELEDEADDDEDEEEDEEDSEDDDDDDDDDEEEDEEDSEDDDDDDDDDEEEVDERAELRKVMQEQQKAVAATLSHSAKADAEKGRAVKSQRATFDSLLNARVKLQKALVGTNTLSGLAEDAQAEEEEYPADAFHAAETAAFNLWSSLNDLRETLESTRTGKKRSHSEFTLDSPTSELWTHMKSQETSGLAHRNNVIEKWSKKARGAAVEVPRNRLNNTTSDATIVDVLREQLSGDRLFKRARTPRSCAPLQLSKKLPESATIYDDADFYGLLLQSLLEQRSADSVAASASAANIDVSFQMRREAKTKKNVDTKASKGRKLRYTVHEKLQNFMAPEDRNVWGERQSEELFGSLFGRKMGLGEDDEDEAVGGAEDEDMEEAGLMLFRN